MLTTKALLLAASIAIAAPGNAQVASPKPDAPASASKSAKPEKTVEGATPGRVAQIERCQGHKFESLIVIDPVKKRTTRVKLCANPGSSDADWVKTLQAAVVQIEQRDMPPAAKEKVIGELNSELAKFASASKPASIARGAPLVLGGDAGALIPPTERYETSVLPPLTPPTRAAAASAAAGPLPPRPPMRARLLCRERGQTGSGGTCDFIDPSTLLSVSAAEGLEKGGRLRFQGRGDARGEIALAPMRTGQSARIRLPDELCRGFGNTKVEIELLGPKSTDPVAARLGTYRLQC